VALPGGALRTVMSGGEALGADTLAWARERLGVTVAEIFGQTEWFKGRSDDLIVSAGYRISPVEVEQCLLRHPAVVAAAVVGIPDELRGQVVKAFVVARDAAPHAGLADELKLFVRTRLAAYEYPRELELVRELPLTGTGKIRRRARLQARCPRQGRSPRRRAPNAHDGTCRRRIAARTVSGVSRNLTELLARREGGLPAPTPLDLLREAVEEHGEVTDDDRRRVAELTGLPEAAVHGVSTFYDDLTQPRGIRHVRACTGTACWAADFGAHVVELERGLGVGLGDRSPDGALSLGETVCLGFCHAASSVRDGDTVDAGAGAVGRVLSARTRPAPEPTVRSTLDEPVLLRPGDFSGLRRALTELTPERWLESVKAANLRGRGGAGFPAGAKWGFARSAPGAQKVVVVNGDEGDPGSYIDKVLLEQNPALVLEGAALAGYAAGAERGFVYVRSEYPRARRAVEQAIASAVAAGDLGDDIRGSGFSFHVSVAEGAGSYVVGEETALLASLEGLRGAVSARPPFPAERGWRSLPTVVNNVETLCSAPFVALHGPEAFAALSPGATPGTKLVCLNERFARPGAYEVRLGTPLHEICDALGGGMRDGRELKALQIGGPLGGILPAALLDTPLDFEPLAAVGCMLGHGSIVGFDDRTDMRALAQHLLAFGARESCGKCFPCRIGLRRGLELVEADAPVDRALLEELLETLELASLCAHGTGMPAPIRSLLAHWPDELGAA
jgi:NADH:ubiquinone oxidoreductase subunit F (NADH-binding)/NADH:ubiquinone oxidoreductase subunit E